MSFAKNLLYNISQHYAVNYFLDQKRENRLLLIAALSFAFIIMIHLSNIVIDRFCDNVAPNLNIPYLQSQPDRMAKKQLFTANDFCTYINKAKIDPLSRNQIMAFMQKNDIVDVQTYQDQYIYTFLTRHKGFTIVYRDNQGWYYENHAKNGYVHSIPFVMLDSSFYDNVNIVAFFDEAQKSLMQCVVTNPNGLTIQAPAECNVRLTHSHTISIKYPQLTIDDNNGVMMLITFNQNTPIARDNAHKASSITSTNILVKRGDSIAHIPHGTTFTLQLLRTNQQGQVVGYNPITTSVCMHVDI